MAGKAACNMTLVMDLPSGVSSPNAGQRGLLAKYYRLAEPYAVDDGDQLERALRARTAHMRSLALYGGRRRRARLGLPVSRDAWEAQKSRRATR